MRYCVYILIFSIGILFACTSPRSSQERIIPPPNNDGYQLVWQDEFNKDGILDSTNWGYEIGFERNEELQFYQKENAYCKNGLLVLEARREHKSNPYYEAGGTNMRTSRQVSDYTSASVKTQGKRSWLYGRFEMRGRIDISTGLWPAWWTLGVDKRWPANGEIDIMEYYRGVLLANIACLGTDRKPEWHSNRFSTDSLGGISWSSKFHIWRMDWTEQYIQLYVDNVLLNKVTIDELRNKDGSNFNPFRQPHYMMLDLAIGGTQGGNPGSTSFPRKFEIDWVRVWQK